MKTKYFAWLPVVLLALGACDDKKNLGPEELTLSATELDFASASESKTLNLKATIDWGIQWSDETDKAWLSIDPDAGKASAEEKTITITVLENTGENRSATVTFYGNVLHKQTVTISQAGEKGDGEAITVAEFIAKADTQTPFVLEGKVSNVNGTYKYFNLSDGTGTVQIYQPVNFDSFSIENGGTARVKGVYERFEKNDGTVVHEMKNGNILSYEGPDLGDHIFAQTFSASLGDFTEEVKSGTVNPVWAYDSKYKCAKATAYVDGKNNASESWLISPEIDLTSETAATLVFDHACNYFTAVSNEVSLWASKNGADFVQLVIPTYPTSFTFVSSGKISLKDFLGAKVKIALVYTSTATKAGTYEVQNFFVDAEDSGETVYPRQENCNSVSEIIALAKDTKFNCTAAMLVVAKSTGGVVVSDQTGNLYLYDEQATANVAIGDKITFSGLRTVYNGVPEVTGLSNVTVASSGNEVTYPEVKDIIGGFDGYSSAVAEYISMTGTLSKSQNAAGTVTYYNLAVPGATMQGSISLPSASLGLDALEGKMITVTGYYNGTSGSSTKYHNIIAVKVEEASGLSILTVDKTAITVAAGEVSATINVGGNASWTVSCSDENLTATPASGTGEAAVTLAFPENTDTENAKTYTVRVSTEDPAPVKEFTVVITQKKASSGTEQEFELTNDEIVAAINAAVANKANGYTEITINSASGEWQGKMNAQKDVSYVQLRAKDGACIKSPAFEKDIKRIELRINSKTGAQRIIHAIPSDSVPSSGDYKAADWAAQYGQAASTGNVAETLTINVDGAVKDFALIVSGGAVYIDSILVVCE